MLGSGHATTAASGRSLSERILEKGCAADAACRTIVFLLHDATNNSVTARSGSGDLPLSKEAQANWLAVETEWTDVETWGRRSHIAFPLCVAERIDVMSAIAEYDR
jgi:hypothetical protein